MKIIDILYTVLILIASLLFLLLDFSVFYALFSIFCKISDSVFSLKMVFEIWWIILIIRAVLYSEAKRRAQK